MLNSRQEDILDILKEYRYAWTRHLQEKLGISRARLNQLIIPMLKEGLIKRFGKARATRYCLAEKKKQNRAFLERENDKLKLRVKVLEQQLEDRKIIERAKEILVAQFDISPMEAYRKLQEQSMSRRKSMRKVANAILEVYEGLV